MIDLFALPDWIDQSLCSKVGNPEDWFPTDGDNYHEDTAWQQAIAVCNRCPVRTQCLQLALDTEIGEDGTPLPRQGRFGIYGGTFPADRAKLATGTA